MVMLRQAADVFGGIRPPSRNDPLRPSGELKLLQPKDLTTEEIAWDQLPKTDVRPNPKHYLRDGDVLVLLRGTVLRSFLVQPSPSSPVVVSNHIAIVRPFAHRILPGFLVSILNHPTTKQQAQARTSGTTIPFLSIRSLKEIEIPVPSIDVQAQVARIDRLRREYLQLFEQRARLADQLVDTLIRQEVMGGPPP